MQPKPSTSAPSSTPAFSRSMPPPVPSTSPPTAKFSASYSSASQPRYLSPRSRAKRNQIQMMRHSIGALPTQPWQSHESHTTHRLSVPIIPQLDRPSMDTPETVLMRTSLRFIGLSRYDGHCVYMIEVDSGDERFVVCKRYSEIREFRRELFSRLQEKKSHCGMGACKQLDQLTQIRFPRRRISLKRDGDLSIAQARTLPLERFLQATLRVYRLASRRQLRSCMNNQCAMLELIRQFLEVSEPVCIVSPCLETVAASDDEDDWSWKAGTSYLQSPDMPSSAPRSARQFPPTTRVSMKDFGQQQLHPISEDLELLEALR
ncbi:hypothetical protein P43SY_011923 [Pythium insidiosum]|uniref:PX domain-containing protein n=1 Tax=Pythium insidiosum TaxID=114742 RepID=A0AAD5L671_PYTIN|nr:hypothetical protein P43SY_011923 [Pythium insidiosum]